MHSQAELIKYLSEIRRLLVGRHEEVVAGDCTVELCLCHAIEDATDHDAEHPMQVAVKQMIQAAFADDGQEYQQHRYVWPVAVTYHAFRSETGFRGTPEQVAEGYTKRLALIDKWIAAAHKKLLAAVFRKAIGELDGQPFMCNAVKVAVHELEGGDGDWWEYKSALLTSALEVLELFKPSTVDMKIGWYNTTFPRLQALRRAILNLCITEVTRGFK